MRHAIREFRQGYNLVELAIVLGVIGVVMGLIWGYASTAYESVRRSQAQQEVTAVVSNIRSAYGGRLSLPAKTKAYLIPLLINGGVSGNPNSGIIPQDMVRIANTTCKSTLPIFECADTPWGSSNGTAVDTYGTFQVCNWDISNKPSSSANCDAGAPTGQIFAVALEGLNMGACIQLATNLSGAAGPTGLLDVDINNSNIIYNRPATLSGSGSLPVSTSDANTLCQTGNTNIVRFIYKLRLPSN